MTCSATKASPYLGDSLGIELVNIFVSKDPNRKRFVIHKKLICDKVDFFHKAFMGGFKENEGTMDLPDEKPAVFAMFFDWLYRSDSEVGRVTTTEQFVGLFKLYFFAENFCVNDLQNRLIDRIRLASGGSPRMGNCGPQITIAFAAFIFKNTPTGSELRNYCIHELAWRLWIYGTGTTMPDSNNILSMFSLWSDQNELIEKYFEFLRCNPTEIHGL